MGDNTTPERMWIKQVEAWYDGTLSFLGFDERDDESIEYIRADVAQAQLDAANARIAELEAVQRWVSVDERLPDTADRVLVYSNDYDGKGFYIENCDAWFDVLHHHIHGVTHWMPLPPPPVTAETEQM